MNQVIGNLLENAARHTPAGTQIRVRAAAEGPLVRLTIEDNGPGLPAGDPERLFAKFHRGQEEGNTGGAGLGLAICRAIVNAQGGEIHASRSAAGGAQFTFTLPATEPG
jgi:two-component system sensor histidine kinase KdpD